MKRGSNCETAQIDNLPKLKFPDSKLKSGMSVFKLDTLLFMKLYKMGNIP